MTYTYDGHPITAGVEGHTLIGRVPEFSMVGLVECVVVDRRYVGDPGNRTGTSVEYDVRDLQSGQVYNSCVLLSSVFGVNGASERILQPATKTFKVGKRFTKRTKASDTDGDIVVVGFLNGSRSRPVILGSKASPSTTYAAKSADGNRLYVKHFNVDLKVNPDGSMLIQQSPGTSITIDANGNLTFSNTSDTEASFTVALNGPGNIKLGGQALQPTIMGTNFQAQYDALVAQFNALVAQFNAHFHTSAAPSNPTSPPTVPSTASAETLLSTSLTEVVNVQ